MPEALTYELPPRPEDLAAARHALRGWMAGQGVGSPSADDLLAVAGEFLLQAIAKADPGATIVLRAERRAEGVAISVMVDTAATEAAVAPSGGVVRPLRAPPAPDPLADGTIGRRIVDEVCDTFEVRATGGRLTMQCWRNEPAET